MNPQNKTYGPKESKRLLLEEISKDDGMSIEKALEFGKREDVWFGQGKDVVDVLTKKEELGYIEFNEDTERFILK